MSGQQQGQYLLDAPQAPVPPGVEINGYQQTVERTPRGYRIDVEVSAPPLRVRIPFRPGLLPRSLGLPPEVARGLRESLAGCQRADEAVEAVLLYLRTHLHYASRPDFTESIPKIFERGEASCVGLTAAACGILNALGIHSREVVGILLPSGTSSVRLEGGMLHAWVEVDYGESNRVYCDVLRSSGWVSAEYIVLRSGEGLSVGTLARYTGATLTRLEFRDRLFYEPAPGKACVLWKRPEQSSFTGTLLSGKLLGPMDAPLTGQAELIGGGASTSMPLWEGNFFFRDLEPGRYRLVLRPTGGPPVEAPITLGPMDKRSLVFYSRNGGARGLRSVP